MAYGKGYNPVLFLVLVFLLLFNGCSGEKEILELMGDAAHNAPAQNAPVQSVAEQGSIPEDASATEPAWGKSPAVPGAASENAAGAASDGDPSHGAVAAPSGTENQEPSLAVHICGAVRIPGVYTLPEGSRVCDAVEAAGGFGEGAAEELVNQAALLQDGIQLVILTREEADGLVSEAGQGPALADGQSGFPAQGTAGFGDGVRTAGGSAPGGPPSEAASGLVNINTASAEELMTLPGVGETRAAAILAYRQAHGAFGAIEDIMKVDGIKEGSFAKLKERITV